MEEPEVTRKDKKRKKVTEEEASSEDVQTDELSELLEAIVISEESEEKPNKHGQQKKKSLLFSEVSMDDSTIITGYSNDHIKIIDAKQLQELNPSSKANQICRHNGISCLRASTVSPSIFYSSSSKEGTIFQWDQREAFKPVQKFAIKSEGGFVCGTKAILNFDVNQDDQVICGGTELTDQDCYLLFWDVRSTKLLGAYWESHSDDITTVNFSPGNSKHLASGSTDGLLNIFDIGENTEDDALLYSFNSESSVDAVCWGSSSSSTTESGTPTDPFTTIACLTHTNDIQTYSTESGDPLGNFNRKTIAGIIQEGISEDSVYLQGSYRTSKSGSLGILACSLGGSAARVLNIEGSSLKPGYTFSGQHGVIQSASPFHNSKCWFTFDEEGVSKLWRPSADGQSQVPKKKKK